MTAHIQENISQDTFTPTISVDKSEMMHFDICSFALKMKNEKINDRSFRSWSQICTNHLELWNYNVKSNFA